MARITSSARRKRRLRAPASARPAQAARGPARALGAGIGVLGGEGLLTCLHPPLGEALAIADITIPLAATLTLLAAILLGSNQTVERVFRLLRWIANRPEPPGPSERA